MNKCLVTKLQAIVDNNNLVPLGSLRIYFKKNQSIDINNRSVCLYFSEITHFKSTAPLTAYNNGTTVLVNNLSEGDLSSTMAWFIFPNDIDGYVDFFGKYTLYRISLPYNHPFIGSSNASLPFGMSIDIGQLNYDSILNHLVVSGPVLVGEYKPAQIQIFNSASLNAVSSNPNLFKANIGVFKDSTSLTTLTFQTGENLYGDITQLENLTALTSLQFSATSCTGELKTLLDALHTNGRTSGSINIRCGNSLATYDGEVLSTVTVRNLNHNGSGSTLKFNFNVNGWEREDVPD